MHPDAPLFFDRRPEFLPLYDVFESAVQTRFPDCGIRVQKTQISFDAPGLFACISLPRRKADNGLIVSIFLAAPVESARMLHRTEPYPGRWTHHLLLGCEEEIDSELMGWLEEAHAFALSKRRTRAGKHAL